MSWLALSECVRLLRFASNSLRVNTSNKPNLSAAPQTITLAIRWSQSLPNDCDKPPAPHCCYTGHHGNCFHKGSRGMSCVSYFLASLLLLGDLLHCGGPGTERRRRSCAENTDPHTASLMDTVQPGGNQTFTGKQQWHHILPSWILFFLLLCVLGSFCLIFLWNTAWKMLRIKFTQLSPRRVLCCCWSTTSVCVYTNKNTHWCCCQTHVLMAPDIIQRFLLSPGCCSVHSMWCIPLVYRPHLSHEALLYII